MRSVPNEDAARDTTDDATDGAPPPGATDVRVRVLRGEAEIPRICALCAAVFKEVAVPLPDELENDQIGSITQSMATGLDDAGVSTVAIDESRRDVGKDVLDETRSLLDLAVAVELDVIRIGEIEVGILLAAVRHVGVGHPGVDLAIVQLGFDLTPGMEGPLLGEGDDLLDQRLNGLGLGHRGLDRAVLEEACRHATHATRTTPDSWPMGPIFDSDSSTRVEGPPQVCRRGPPRHGEAVLEVREVVKGLVVARGHHIRHSRRHGRDIQAH